MTEMVMTSEAPVSHSLQMHAVVAFDSDDMSSVLHLCIPLLPVLAPYRCGRC
jgi:hypothetical protein